MEENNVLRDSRPAGDNVDAVENAIVVGVRTGRVIVKAGLEDGATSTVPTRKDARLDAISAA